MKKYWIIPILVIFFALNVCGQQDETGVFHAREFTSSGDTLRYRILYPKGYKKEQKKKYPLVIFLHGSGERGNDNQAQLTHGSALFLDKDNREKYPAIVIFPQCPNEDTWATYSFTENSDGQKLSMPYKPEQTKAGYLVQRLVNHYLKKEPVDSKRVYIMGLSMGGMGTLDMIVRNPKTYTAAIAICGAIEPSRLKNLKKMPLRFYHGTVDPVVPVSCSRDAFYELKAAGSSLVELIEYPEIGHDSWNLAFSSGDFLAWLFSFKR